MWIAIQRDHYLMPHEQGAIIPPGWSENTTITPQETQQRCREVIDLYAKGHHLISAYVTPKSHRESVRKHIVERVESLIVEYEKLLMENEPVTSGVEDDFYVGAITGLKRVI